MIEFDNVSFQYKSSDRGRVEDLSLSVKKGETVLLCGPSGAGKTTILRLINGLIPHYYKGELTGGVRVGGKNIRETELYDLAGIVGTVFQNPRSQFFSVDTDGEVVFGPENIGLPPEEICRRKHRVSEEMHLSPLLDRSLFELSGGEKQKIACASVAALYPEVMLLDEPSSNLDWKAVGELRRVIRDWKNRGKTILISEHRLWYVCDLADRVLYVRGGRIEQEWSGERFRSLDETQLRRLELRPAGIEQSFSEAFRGRKGKTAATGELLFRDYCFAYEKKQKLFRRSRGFSGGSEPLTLDVPELRLPRGKVIGLVGSNGAGKSTLLRCVCGLEKKCKGTIVLDGREYAGKKALDCCYLVMQDVNHQLFTDSVLSEVLLSMERPDPVKAGAILETMGLGAYAETHPMALSGGQKQRVAIASAIAAEAELLLFDEPTSGLDYIHMCTVGSLLRELSRRGKTVLVSTHDPELLTLCADEIAHIEGGRIVEQYVLNEETTDKLKRFFLEYE